MTTSSPRRSIGKFSRYSGPHSITGTVKVLTTAAERPVVLQEEKTFAVARATRSVGGNYTFEKVKAGRWLVLAIDDTAQYNAVVVDRVVTG
jgi:hypothetical protein